MLFNLFIKKNPEPRQLVCHTDIHCHVLPGIDHGSPDTHHSLDLIDAMIRWGIKRFIATPHVTETTFPNTQETILAADSVLRRELNTSDRDIDFISSAEYRIDDFFFRQLADNRLIPMPDNNLLVELNFLMEPINLPVILFNLKVKGFQPIVAHPERYLYLDLNRCRELRNSGSLLQVNLLSLAGYYGKDVKKNACKLVAGGLADFIATDLHHSSHVEAIDRFLSSADYRSIAGDLKASIKNDTLRF